MSRESPIGPQIIEEASDWFVAMRESVVLSDAQEAFADWLRASPLHVRAYLDIARIWSDAAQLGTQADIDLARDLARSHGSSNVIQLSESRPVRTVMGPLQRTATESVVQPEMHPGTQPELQSDMQPEMPLERPSDRRGARWSRANTSGVRRHVLAASIAAALLGSTIAAWWHFVAHPVYATRAGEQRTLRLSDGSLVRLDSRSRIRVHLSRAMREIDLTEGRAFFEVAKDPARPFLVRSGTTDVRAVGTQFDVYRKSSGTVVTVVEGRVAVSGSGGDAPTHGGAALVSPSREAVPKGAGSHSPSSALLLDAGERVVVTAAGAVESPTTAQVSAETSWLRQELVFQQERLGVVIEEFNRYTDVPIVIADPSLAELRVNAVFLTTSPNALLRFLERLEGVEVQVRTNEIRISRRH